MSNSTTKRSYHASGKLHVKKDGKEETGDWVTPLKEIKGQFHLMTIGIQNSRDWKEGSYKNIEYSNKKTDNVIFIDSRSIPDKEKINIMVGLMEPNNYEILNAVTKTMNNVKSVNLATHETPWVYGIVIWPVEIPELPNKAPKEGLPPSSASS
jgi:hypothetical protein